MIRSYPGSSKILVMSLCASSNSIVGFENENTKTLVVSKEMIGGGQPAEAGAHDDHVGLRDSHVVLVKVGFQDFLVLFLLALGLFTFSVT